MRFVVVSTLLKYLRRGSGWLVMGLAWTLAAAGCASRQLGAEPDFLRPGKAPIYRVSEISMRALCGVPRAVGCANCTDNQIYILRRIRPGSAEFIKIIEHEDAHIEMGCTDLDHCKMDRSLLANDDFCPGWRNYLEVVSGD